MAAQALYSDIDNLELYVRYMLDALQRYLPAV